VYVYDVSSAGQLISSGHVAVAKGSTLKTYDVVGDTVVSTTELPTTVRDITPLNDGRLVLTSGHTKAMVYDPSSGTVTTVETDRILGRGARLLNGSVIFEGGVVFQSGSTTVRPLTSTVVVSPFINP
jgi:hypothetical protein